MPLTNSDVFIDVLAPTKTHGRAEKMTSDGDAMPSIRTISAAAGALASCTLWFLGTFAIFAAQGASHAGAAVPFLLA